jgi:murein L,D-transpeptidase YcbB/YkuD
MSRRDLVLVVGLGLSVLGGGCSANPEAAPLPANESPKEAYPGLYERLREQAGEQAGAVTLEGALGEAGLAERLHHEDLLKEIYGARKWRPALLSAGTLSPGAQAWLEALRGSRADGMTPTVFHVDEAEAVLARLEERQRWLQGAVSEAPSPSAAEAQRLRAVYEQGAAPGGAALVEALRGEPVAEGGLRAWYDRVVEAQAGWSREAATLELLLGDGLMHYVALLRLGQAGAHPEARLVSPGLEVAAREGQREFLRGLLEGGEVDEVVGKLRPGSEQYMRLSGALARYEEIAGRGGWGVELPYLAKPKRGKQLSYTRSTAEVPEGVVRQLKVRLKAEGFYEGELESDLWDDVFERALLAYQETHQFDVKQGEIDYELLESMRVPVEYRVAQIKSSLRRLRESRVRDYKGYFVLINLPDFHAEVWDQGERKMRFRVVVGSAEKEWDRENKRWKFPNATPRFSDVMETIIFNPPWTVPPRIRRELERKLAKDPEFYEKGGYELVPSAGGDVLRQKPGRENALGKVKFLFPNDDDIYMHDTPNKNYFQRSYRAYSHGCMRVQDPIDFAYFLLKRDDPSIQEKQVRGAATSNKQFRYTLKNGPEVHIEYRTVRVDEEGKVYFLADIYELDKEFIGQEYGLTFEKRP